MALKITCPSCGEPNRLSEPYPLPGAEVQCHACGRGLTISYPSGMVSRLRARGVGFVEQVSPAKAQPVQPRLNAPPAPAGPAPSVPAPSIAAPPRVPPPRTVSPRPVSPPLPLDLPEPVTQMEGHFSRPTSPTERIDPQTAAGAFEEDPESATEMFTDARPEPAPPPPVARPTPRAAPPKPAAPSKPAAQPRPAAPRKAAAPPKATATAPKRSLLRRMFRWLVVLVLLGGVLGGGGLAGIFWYYGRDLPTVEALGQYRPPAVTVVLDSKGEVLGEVYEKRRYVVELDQIPQHVRDAFMAAEDANFYEHGGIDYMGIVRAVLRNAAKGRKAQGASTITQQVARNFLLTNEKTLARKVKEIQLAHRIEDTFDKDHILYLYLNQIYLGSGAYGVEAASRTYFDKHVGDITLAEAAMLAGLPQRPSDYSPLQHWEKARARQEYVLGQMLDKKYIDKATFDAATAEVVTVVDKENPFLKAAPWFTEHVRRYLVETYGFDKVYNDGLEVDTTCDLELQKLAQKAVLEGATSTDERIGWRGPKNHIEAGDIQGRLDATEQSLREEISHRTLHVADPASGKGGYAPLPDVSALEPARVYEAVILDVAAKHAVAGVGAHKVLIPLSWTLWAYTPNPERSFKSRALGNMTDALKKGDIVDLRIEGLSTEEFANLKGYADAGPGPFAAGRLVQSPELQAAMFSYRLEDGAVVAMVGGTSFENSEYNRAIQARRQVGSTFKPVVYAAAIESKQFTTGSMVQDAPTVFNVLDEKLWKPGNYGEKYLGNITLRRALQMSRNVCTIRVLDKTGLDGVFELAGPRLRIGYNEPSCSRTHISAEATCDGTTSPSRVPGMVWCERCDPNSCPMIKEDPQYQCLDEATEFEGERFCHSCDVNLRVCDWLPISKLTANERCIDERRDEQGNLLCHACDLSMGLGSSSLTMVELSRAYSAFATYGHLVEPHFINKVRDRDGTVIEEWQNPGSWPEVMDPAVAGIAHWLLTQVTNGGTASKSSKLGLHVAGKTGTTNDFFDAWFVGYNTKLLTSVWIGYDQPRSIGVSWTGGEAALPIWMDYMEVAAPKADDKSFPPLPGVVYVPIDESTGRVARGGFPMPMLPNTAPTNMVMDVGQKTSEDLLTSDF